MSLTDISNGGSKWEMGLKHITFVCPLVLVFYLYNYQLGSRIGPAIKISNGVIEGACGVTRDGREYFEFLGIPYARPPVGDLRFEPPQPVLDWDGFRLSNDYGPQCTQIEFFTKKLLGKEDCLYLNVFIPKINGEISTKLLPVMVYIHGGYFMSGASNAYRPEYLMDKDIVLVTMNFRTAALGFLNTGDEVVRGNMGLKDQIQALKWIQTNIAKLGGDKNKVTLFGNSAGAASAHYHIVSPMSKGLFHKAISESGTAVKPWSFVNKPAEQAKRLGEKLNCPTENSTALVSCLKSLSANEIISTHWEYLSVFLDPLAIYAPSIEAANDENTFLAEHPREILEKGTENKVPWMCGLNSDEGLLFTARIIENEDAINKINNHWTEVAPILLGYSENPQHQEITNKISAFYFKGNVNINFRRDFQNFTNMFSDRLYYTASRESAMQQRRNSPVYAYYYTYPGQFSFASILQLSGKLPAIVELGISYISNWIRQNIFGKRRSNLGVCHGDELVMVFNLRFLSDIKSGHPDYHMSKAIVKLWTDFARTEYSDTLEFKTIKWPPLKSTGPLKYLNLDSIPRFIDEPFTERVEFWNSLSLWGYE